jgi:Kef-type K+ transport system membrane component KefB
LAIWFKISTALSEIVVGTIAQLVAVAYFAQGGLLGNTPWITFLAGTGAIVLTFLAGAELDPIVFKTKWRETLIIGLAGFFGPFLGCTAVAYYVLHWSVQSSWLCGVALSTTSVAVVYAVMLELGFNVTEYGKSILAACFINDIGTVVALGMIFSPFTIRTLIFVVVASAVIVALPFITPRFFNKYGGRVSEIEAKYLLFLLFALGGLAVWAGSEAVLPAYIIGIVLAGTVGKDHALIRRLRTLTLGLLTPFYFIRAGSFVLVPVLIAAPAVMLILFLAKSLTKAISVYPAVLAHRSLLHADDVYRLDVRHHLRALRAQSPHHRPEAILLDRGHGNCQRRDSHHDSESILFAPASSSPRTYKQEIRTVSSAANRRRRGIS